MKTVTKKYMQLIKRVPLVEITTEEDSAIAAEMLDELFDRFRELDEGEREYFNVLTMLRGNYETAAHPYVPPRLEPLQLLRFLMEENDTKQVDLVKLLGISSGNASEIVNGKRELTKEQIPVVADFFKVDPAAFLPRVNTGGMVTIVMTSKGA
jgi:HTH-type transcriptional regulator/antitoxin HigA